MESVEKLKVIVEGNVREIMEFVGVVIHHPIEHNHHHQLKHHHPDHQHNQKHQHRHQQSQKLGIQLVQMVNVEKDSTPNVQTRNVALEMGSVEALPVIVEMGVKKIMEFVGMVINHPNHQHQHQKLTIQLVKTIDVEKDSTPNAKTKYAVLNMDSVEKHLSIVE